MFCMHWSKTALAIFSFISILIFVQVIYAENTDKSKKGDRSLQITNKSITDSRKKIALVVGNSSYLSSPLKNPANDASAMAVVLNKLGFEVQERINLNYINFNEAVEAFGNKLQAGGIGLFYYAGHGMQVSGNNYLIPVDAKINSENEVRYKAIDAGLVLAKMEQAKSDVNIVIMDACRDNPFVRSFRSSVKGLAQVDAPAGTIIAYATAPGKTANDGDGSNGIYTEALIEALRTPGLKVEDVFKKVRKLVMDKTDKIQVPWESSSLVGDFHFIPGSNIVETKSEPEKQVVATKTELARIVVQPSDDIEKISSSDLPKPKSIRPKIKMVGDVKMEESIRNNQTIIDFSASGFSNQKDIVSRKASAEKDVLKKIKKVMLAQLKSPPYFYSVDKITGLYDNGEIVELDYINDGKEVKIKYRISY